MYGARIRAVVILAGSYVLATYLAYSVFDVGAGRVVKYAGALALIGWSTWDSARAAAQPNDRVGMVFLKKCGTLIVGALVLISLFILLAGNGVASSS